MLPYGDLVSKQKRGHGRGGLGSRSMQNHRRELNGVIGAEVSMKRAQGSVKPAAL
jgi:hypothetical protein